MSKGSRKSQKILESHDDYLTIASFFFAGITTPNDYAMPFDVGYCDTTKTNKAVNLRQLNLRLMIEISSEHQAEPPKINSGLMRLLNPYPARLLLVAYNSRDTLDVTIDQVLDLSAITDPRLAFRKLAPTLGVQVIVDLDLPVSFSDSIIRGNRVNAPAPPDDLYDVARTTTYFSEVNIDCSMLANFSGTTYPAIRGWFIFTGFPTGSPIASWRFAAVEGRLATRGRYDIQNVSLIQDLNAPHMHISNIDVNHHKYE